MSNTLVVMDNKLRIQEYGVFNIKVGDRDSYLTALHVETHIELGDIKSEDITIFQVLGDGGKAVIPGFTFDGGAETKQSHIDCLDSECGVVGYLESRDFVDFDKKRKQHAYVQSVELDKAGDNLLVNFSESARGRSFIAIAKAGENIWVSRHFWYVGAELCKKTSSLIGCNRKKAERVEIYLYGETKPFITLTPEDWEVK